MDTQNTKETKPAEPKAFDAPKEIMHATLLRKDLENLLLMVSKIAPKRAMRAALTNTMLVAKEDKLEAQATDLEIYGSRLVSATIVTSGQVLVPWVKLQQFVKKLKGESVTLRATTGHGVTDLEVSSNRVSLTLRCYDPEKFPVIPEFEPKWKIPRISMPEVRAALIDAMPFAAKEQGRYAMHGILVLSDHDTGSNNVQPALVSTDGRRLLVRPFGSCTPRGEQGEDYKPGTGILPMSLARALKDLLPKDEKKLAELFSVGSTLELTVGEYDCAVEFNSTRVVCRMVDGEFPRWSAIVKEQGSSANFVDLLTKATLERLDQVAIVTTADARAVTLLHSGGQEIVFVGNGVSGSTKGTVKLPRQGSKGEAEIAFNPDFMVDALKVFGTDEVAMEWADRTSPIHLRARGLTVAIMPITVDL